MYAAFNFRADEDNGFLQNNLSGHGQKSAGSLEKNEDVCLRLLSADIKGGAQG